MKEIRAHLLGIEPFSDVFGSKAKRKRPTLMVTDYESLLKKADNSQDAFEDKYVTIELGTNAGLKDLVRHTMFERVRVLDARDPQGTRCYHLEKHLKENCKHKKMMLLLNKCDLVPKSALKGWLRILSQEYPCLAFNASHLKKTFGLDHLLMTLRQISSLKKDKQTISVGFVGYPNVGKSSIIKCVKRLEGENDLFIYTSYLANY